jgi:hypothetical protein
MPRKGERTFRRYFDGRVLSRTMPVIGIGVWMVG